MQTFWISLIPAGLLWYAGNSKMRFEFQARDMNKFVDISIVLLAVIVVLGLSREAKTAIWFLFKWLPVALFPIFAAQKISTDNRIDIRAFHFATRKKRRIQKATPERKIDLSYAYALVCILSAGMSAFKDSTVERVPVQDENIVYFVVCAVLLVWALWRIRSPRFSNWIWAVLMAGIIVSGFFGQRMVRKVGFDVRRWIISQYAGFYTANPFKSFTAMGEIGRLKLSDKIVIRADTAADGLKMPLYLQNGIFTRFVNDNWFNRSPFTNLDLSRDQTTWILIPNEHGRHEMTLYSTPSMRRSVLSLPEGALRISSLKADKCAKNSMQIVRAEGLPPFVKIVVDYMGKPLQDPDPNQLDLVVPRTEAAVLQKVFDGLDIQGEPEDHKIQAIKKYFADHYAYSLDLAGKGKAQTSLQNFLLNTQKGHCELFATATVLLLRKSGIPARYVTGFLMHEFSKLENQYVVRERDAHAWARAFVDGAWVDLDTTPPNFLAFDQTRGSVSPVRDFFSFLLFQVSKLRYETGKKILETYGIWLILPLVIILWHRLRQASRIRPADQEGKGARSPSGKMLTESFYLLETHLLKKGCPRKKHETYDTWIYRILKTRPEEKAYKKIQYLLFLHKKMVFGKGLTHDQENFLFREVRGFIDTELPLNSEASQNNIDF